MGTVNPAEEASSLSQLNLPTRIFNLLTQAGITDIEALNLRMETDPGTILAISGIGPHSISIIKDALESVGAELSEGKEPIVLPADQSKPVSKPKKEKAMAKDKKPDKKKTKKKADKEKVKKLKTKGKVKETKKGKKVEKKVKKSKKKDTKKKDTKKKDTKKKESKKKKGKKK
jgi:hypothetical protein